MIMVQNGRLTPPDHFPRTAPITRLLTFNRLGLRPVALANWVLLPLPTSTLRGIDRGQRILTSRPFYAFT